METIALSREEILKIEKETEEKYGISGRILMENAGRCTAEVVADRYGEVKGKKVYVVSGKGNNGGDGFVAARNFFNMGADLKVFYLGSHDAYSEEAFTNYEILCKMGVSTFSLTDGDIEVLKLADADIVVDAIFGIGLNGEVRGSASELIKLINRSGKFVACVDVPSGLDADTGKTCGVTVRGNVTVTFGFAKRGFYLNEGPEYCGEIVVADIGFPRFYYKTR
jgi:ADP-dependent NAD(P)H-hydrate dehydratase / NAD(P)H-hydrate epimerase